MHPSRTLTVEAYFDLICPWCLIGKRHLEAAVAMLAHTHPDAAVQVTWRSYPLMPILPPEGIPYREFYLARLGSAEAVAARRAQVRAAAQEAGVTLEFERIQTMPNTVLAHRLVRFAERTAGPRVQAALVDDLFRRYFQAGEDIGDPMVLRRAATAAGVPAPGGADDPIHHELEWLPALLEPGETPPRNGMGVPHFVIDGNRSVSGARHAAVLHQTMAKALDSASKSGEPAQPVTVSLAGA